MAVVATGIDKFVKKYTLPSAGKETLILAADDGYIDGGRGFDDLLSSEDNLEKIGKLSVFSSVIVVSKFPLDGPSLRCFVENLHHVLGIVEGIRFAYVAGIGPGCCVAQQLAITQARFVRRLALFEPVSRVLGPTKLDLMIDSLESHIPCGLPLRKGGTNFDSRSEIHRVHCPSLVCASPESTSFISEEADFLASRMPNAWRGEFDINKLCESSGLLAFMALLADFLVVPAKAPQKNLRY